MLDFAPVQEFMRTQKIDAWLLHDFRGGNSIFAQLLPGKRHTTRRAELLVPASGEPTLLAHDLDANQFSDIPFSRERYLTWGDYRDWLALRLAGLSRVAMEYSPGAALPVVSMVDAGTVELVRSFGVEVVSSANLIQAQVARWTQAAREAHLVANLKVGRIKDEAFELIRDKLKAGATLHEHEVAQFIRDRFAAEGLETPDGPIVAVNAHAGDPHYEPSASHPTKIQQGDWVLIDLWARVPGDENVFADITWVGVVAPQASARQREVFEAVRAARDGVVQRAQRAFAMRERVQGWELDDVARNIIIKAGFGEFIKHRTGHSLSAGPKVHGVGFNLDNLETHDTREMLPGTGFTIEPGIYLEDFGVRLEIDVHVHPQNGPVVTSGLQEDILYLV